MLQLVQYTQFWLLESRIQKKKKESRIIHTYHWIEMVFIYFPKIALKFCQLMQLSKNV